MNTTQKVAATQGRRVALRLDRDDARAFLSVQRRLSPLRPEQAGDTAVLREALKLASLYLAAYPGIQISSNETGDQRGDA